MGRVKFWTSSGKPSAICGRHSRFALFLLLLAYGLWPMASNLYSQTELGSEDDLTVLGANGTAADPDTEIKGFTVFGATQAAYPGASAGQGNVVVNGVLSVSSGAYFVDSSTFPAAGKIFINDGSTGQILSKKADGALQWTSSSAMGDDLGNHVATTSLNMSGFAITGVSTLSAVGVYISEYGVIQTTGPGLGGFTASYRGAGAVDLQAFRSAADQAAEGSYSVIGGGRENTAYGQKATVGGGELNLAYGGYSVISGGGSNRAGSGSWGDTVSGGQENVADGGYSVVAGGYQNVIGNYGLGVISGGEYNFNNGNSAVIAGGESNSANGAYSFIAGGRENTAKGQYSFSGGRGSSSTANGSFTWADSQGQDAVNSVVDRTMFKNRGGFLITGSTNPAMTGTLNRGMLVTGNGLVGISTGVPYAALDVVSSGTASNIYAQIWRNGSGVEVASMTSEGTLYVTAIAKGDNLGNHTATKELDMAGSQILGVSTLTVTGNAFSVGGSTFAVNSGNVGIGTDAPGYKLEVKDTGMAGFQVEPQNGYISLRINGVEVAQMLP